MSRVEGKKCRHFFVILIKKNKQTKQNKTKNTERKKIKKKTSHRPRDSNRHPSARAVPLRHQANPEVTRQN